MPGTQPSIFGVVSRGQPQPANDLIEREVRLDRYGGVVTQPMIRKQAAISDEGFYRIANNNSQSGITDNVGTGFVATVATVIIFNSDSNTNPSAKSIYMDFINLNAVTANTAASTAGSIQAACYLDNTNRFSSGGTQLTANIINPNGNNNSASVALAYCGALTATAATSFARAINPLMYIRTAASGTAFNVAGENVLFNFGPVEWTLNGSITVANANNIPVPMPPVIIGPQQSLVLYLWYAAGTTNAAGTLAPTLAWWER